MPEASIVQLTQLARVCVYMYAFLGSRIQCVTAVQCSHVLLSLQIAVHWSLLLPT